MVRRVMNMKPLLYLLLVMSLLIIPASATITVTPSTITSTSITWTWNPTGVDNISIDGVFVCNVNPSTQTFTLSDLGPNEPHTIQVITDTDYGTNTATTKGDTNADLISTWWYLVLIMVLCAVGMGIRKMGIFLIVASAVSVYALVTFIAGNPITGTDPTIEIPFLIYVVFFIIPLWLCFGVKGGVFK